MQNWWMDEDAMLSLILISENLLADNTRDF